MDTFPSDLRELIKGIMPVTHAILIGVDNDDYSQYLDETTKYRRLQLAKQKQHSGWIHQYNQLSIDERIWRKIGQHAGQINYKFGTYGILNCLHSIKIHHPEFILGLYDGGHREIFEQCLGIKPFKEFTIKICGLKVPVEYVQPPIYHAGDPPHDKYFLHLFDHDDEDYAIKVLQNYNDIFVVHFIDATCCRRRYKIVEYLLNRLKSIQGVSSKAISRISPETILNMALDSKLYLLEDLDGKMKIESSKILIILACRISNVYLLKFLFDCKRIFAILVLLDLLGDHYQTTEVFEFYKRQYETYCTPRNLNKRQHEIYRASGNLDGPQLKIREIIQTDFLEVKSRFGLTSGPDMDSLTTVLKYHFKNSKLTTIRTIFKIMISDFKLDLGLLSSLIQDLKDVYDCSFLRELASCLSPYKPTVIITRLEKLGVVVPSEINTTDLILLFIDNIF